MPNSNIAEQIPDDIDISDQYIKTGNYYIISLLIFLKLFTIISIL